ncbi:MAG: CDP-diacylglycerol--glycerol-3-phosphate 3-phosphatidyltransferase [Elusimicrobia bacterium CG1_02_63_36]|nr:MAG: CDP-diacylglycerol--glycerol-3-phosphate 3-phosphatidyltransferase [Elusimicrobia bacterium CG1_02_63_36]PIP83482.1 MAG: CDP-diacylglycerol--glycerol-3-phosphate 3-phosphatidyltransferase [Elusimicrobia bacterium CG22_combo_CG10-13_8_21_14_all_63_91]PJA12328.1 MAG: CDP-diacylglycerol--glycerol-3-phosphate 3-phosphatidyltransferase [Elusimicrobia bacterium CG_4_10_14_0_2_um_filter_63_34]PJB24720.1 MAG: CDP-diacylglycerol--glycerol-3-phosphate 3-phosphatidyltransferase [Elusimicrobia bacte
MTLANKLTIARLAMALAAFVCLWIQRPWSYAAALALYVVATITDWMDGYIARATKSISPFGKIADPLADKVLVIGALVALVREPRVVIPLWAVFLIIVRELLVGGIRGLSAVQGVIIPADRGGKWKMAIQSVVVILILVLLTAEVSIGWPVPRWMMETAAPLVILSAIVAVLSGLQYGWNARELLKKTWNAPKNGGDPS